jgi:hypothetical protein
MDFSTLAQPWQQQKAAAQTLPTKRNHSYFFAHNPRNWEFIYFEETQKTEGKRAKKIKKGYWLPLLSTIQEHPGVNGVRDGGNGRIDSSITRTKMKDKGWTILSPSDFDYMRIYPALNGKYHSNKFEKLESLAGTLIKEFDHDSFNQWRLELLKSGSIPAPHHSILKRIRLDAAEQINRQMRYQHIPEIKQQIENLQNIISDMDKAIQEIQEKGLEAYE